MPGFRQGLLFGPGLSDGYTTIDVPRMRADRASKMRDVLVRHSIPAILTAGANNTRYLTGLSSFELQRNSTYCLFLAEGEPIVFAPAGSYHQLQDLCPWLPNWRLSRTWFAGVPGIDASHSEAGKFAAEVKDELAHRGLLSEPIAIADFDSYAMEALANAGVRTVPGIPLLLEASAAKTPDEIACLHMAATISNAGFEAARRNLRPGMRQDSVSKAARDAMEGFGADNVRAKTLSGPLAFERPLSDMDRIIEHGDLVYVRTCSTSFMGYMCCLYRTFIVGKEPASKEKDWYKDVKDRIDAMVEVIKPGATTADAALHFPPASTWGYKDEAELNTLELGHGIGLVRLAGSSYANYNYPIINRQWSLEFPQVFEAGMVIAIESREGVHRTGGVRIENMIVVTDSGVERLDTYPDEEIVVCN